MSDTVKRTVSESIARHCIAAFDGAVIFAIGVAVLRLDLLRVDVMRINSLQIEGPSLEWRLAIFLAALAALLGTNLLGLFGAYDSPSYASLRSSIARVLAGSACLFAAVTMAVHMLEPAAAGSWIVAWSLGTLALLTAARSVLWYRTTSLRQEGPPNTMMAVVGSGPIAQQLLRGFSNGQPCPRVFGVYDDRAAELPSHCMGHPIRGTVDDLVRHARTARIDTVIVALPLSADLQLVETLNRLRMLPVDVRLCPDAFGLRLGQVETSHLAGHVFFNVIDRPLRDWHSVAKSIEDRLLGAAILALIAPVLLAIAVLIKLDSPGPVLFRQKRYGFNNELIDVLKFRTMHHASADPEARQLTRRNDPRITRIGALLRRTSLDELPQFLNVIRGEMSIVGPRPHALAAKAGPLLYQDAVKYYDARHRVKPGITGWAQVNGWRGETDTVEQIRKRVEYDLYYIEHWSILFDLKIILRTILGGFTGSHAF